MFVANVDGGYFVSEKHQQIAEIVQDFNADLEVKFIPPHLRAEPEEKEWPYMIVHNGRGTAGGRPYLVMLLSEDEMDGRVIEKLFMAMVDKNDIPARMKAIADAQKVVRIKAQKEQEGMQNEFDAFRLKTPLHTFSHKGRKHKA